MFCVIRFLLENLNVMLLIEDGRVCRVLTWKKLLSINKAKIHSKCIWNAKGNITGIRGAGVCNIDVIRAYTEPIFKWINSIIPVLSLIERITQNFHKYRTRTFSELSGHLQLSFPSNHSERDVTPQQGVGAGTEEVHTPHCTVPHKRSSILSETLQNSSIFQTLFLGNTTLIHCLISQRCNSSRRSDSEPGLKNPLGKNMRDPPAEWKVWYLRKIFYFRKTQHWEEVLSVTNQFYRRWLHTQLHFSGICFPNLS